MSYKNEYNLEKFYNYSLDLFSIQRLDGTVISVNPAFQRALGWGTQELLGRNPFDLVHPEDVESILKEFEKLNQGVSNLSIQNRIRCSDGNYKHFAWTVFPDLESSLVYVTGRDITEAIEANRKISQLAAELKEANDRLFEQASTDPLTQLKNRRSFNEELHHLIKLAQKQKSFLSLFMIDVDHFKEYNDRFGHPAGDKVLINLAFLLEKTLFENVLSARYGGEEFIVALPDTSEEKAAEAAKTLVNAVREFTWEKRSITISLGISTLDPNKSHQNGNVDPSANLIEDADKALYHSKINGRDQATHSSQLKS